MVSTWVLSAAPSPVTASLISFGEYSVTSAPGGDGLGHHDPGGLGHADGGAHVHREQDALDRHLDRWMLGGQVANVALDGVEAFGHRDRRAGS